ncbi:MAG: aminotransferase class IV [Verrucomicrobiota bacterium]
MTLDPWNEGVRFGRGIFETIKVQDGKAILKDWHLESLTRACEALGIQAVDISKFHLKPGMENGIWRWFATREKSWDLWTFSANKAKEFYTLSLSPFYVNSTAWDALYKTMSYLLHVQARESVETDECILLNERHEIASASMGNIFWVKDGVTYTPDISCGCRAGVTRRWVIEKSDQKVEIGAWFLEDLEQADEVFVSNSLIGIMPVAEWQRKGRVTSLRNKLTSTLRDKYHEQLSNGFSSFLPKYEDF